MLFAVGLLLLEAGIVRKKSWTRNLALFVPAVCVYLSIPGFSGSAPYAAFLHQFIDRVGSPLWLAALGGICFYAFACLRQVRNAEPAFWMMLLAGSCMTRTTVDFSGLVAPQAWALWLAAGLQLLLGRWRVDALGALVTAVAAIAGCRASFLAAASPLYRDIIPVHAAGLSLLAVAVIFDDRFARWLRRAGVPLLVGAAFAASLPNVWTASYPPWVSMAYLAGMIGLAFGYGYLLRMPEFFYAGLANLTFGLGRLMYELSGYLKRLFAWEGAAWFVWGLVWFALAALISARKAGITPWLARCVPRGGRRWGTARGKSQS
jgi:hypothetical protein